jgi:hypothetical protein
MGAQRVRKLSAAGAAAAASAVADSPDPKPPVLSKRAQRLAIAFYYYETLDAPPKEEWKQPMGTIYQIRHGLRLSRGQHNTVKRVLENLLQCIEAGVEYDGERKVQKARCRALLQIGTKCARVVADAMERHLGLKKTTKLLNLSRKKRGLDPVGVSAVHGLHLAMQPVITTITDNKQGKDDPDSHWAMARYMFLTQLAIRRGFDVELPCLQVTDGWPPAVLQQGQVMCV